MNFKCLNIKINNLTREKILEKVGIVLSRKNKNNQESKIGKKCLQINTVNPEFILQAQKDKEFREILNSESSLNIADGIGLKFAGWRFGWNLKYRWAGVDLMMEILKIANENKLKVFLIGNKKGLSSWQETAEVILKIYPNLEIKGVDINTQKINANKITNYELRVTSYDIVFCALGAPQQEKLLNYLCKAPTFANAKVRPLQKPRLAMGVGGSFDFLTGKIKRAPLLLRKMGLEWLWRLGQEPRYRFKRIWQAVVIFPIKVVLFNK